MAKHSGDTNSDTESEDEFSQVPVPKKFLAKSLAESLFQGLLEKVRNRGIPNQKGFLHLNKISGYGPTAATKKFFSNWTPSTCPMQNCLRSTVKLTQQAIQEACEKERHKRLRVYHQDGIPRYRPFIDFLDEFRHLVREAERQDQSNATKLKTNVESTWADVMEAIRNKGLMKTINEQVEVQRQDTIYSIWSTLQKKSNPKEDVAMASVHMAKNKVHEELKDAVKQMAEKTRSEDQQMANYYADLRDQMVESLHRKMLQLQSGNQMIREVKIQLEMNEALKDNPIRQKAASNLRAVHQELGKIYERVKKEEKDTMNQIIYRQKKLKNDVLADVVQEYWRRKTFKDIAKNITQQIRERKLEGSAEKPRLARHKVHKEVARNARQSTD